VNPYKIKRNPDGWVVENCPVNPGVKIGSFDCTANCKNNKTTKKDIHTFGFDLPQIICSERAQLKQENQQFSINI
jgi:hypothetical protein